MTDPRPTETPAPLKMSADTPEPRPPKTKRYRITLMRTVTQKTVVVMGGSSPSAAVARACDYAKSGLSWRDGAVLTGPAPQDAAEEIE